MRRLFFISLVITLPFASFCVCKAASLLNHFQGQIYYSGMHVKLSTIDIDSYGWSTRNGKAESSASEAGFSLQLGQKKPLRFSLNFFSNTSLIPLNSGFDKNRELSLQSISALFGYRIGWLPSLQFSQEIFQAIGIADGTTYLLKDGQTLRQYDTFKLGYIYETYMLSWSVYNTEDNKTRFNSSFVRLNIGLVDFTFQSVKHLQLDQNWMPVYSEVEQDMSGLGFGFQFKGYLQDIYTINSFGFDFGVESDISIVPQIGIGFIRGGYDLGLTYKIADFFSINPSIGGYYWWIRNWSFDYSAISTDFGLMYSLKFRLQW